MTVDNSLDIYPHLVDVVVDLVGSLSPKTVALDSSFQGGEAHFSVMVL